MPRVGVSTTEFADKVRDAGGEPVEIPVPKTAPGGGVALFREWISDTVQLFFADENLDVVLADLEKPEELFGVLLAALRLNLPAIVPRRQNVYSIALAALGATPVQRDAAELAVERAGSLEVLRGELIGSFSLANALRAGLSAGGGPELLVHLSALAREGEISGFSQMLRVITPETPAFTQPGSEWLKEQGIEGLLASFGEDLHDVPAVTGWLKETLPSVEDETAVPEPVSRLVFVEGKASGTKAICRSPVGTDEVSGACRVFFSEDKAAEALSGGEIEPGSIVVVGGCGSRGGRGLKRMTTLNKAFEETELTESVSILTDGLAPDGAVGTWISLLTPEAAAGGVISRLQDGDTLRVDLEEGRIKAGISAKDFGLRKAYEVERPPKTGYLARYARTARPALDGAGFN